MPRDAWPPSRRGASTGPQVPRRAGSRSDPSTPNACSRRGFRYADAARRIRAGRRIGVVIRRSTPVRVGSSRDRVAAVLAGAGGPGPPRRREPRRYPGSCGLARMRDNADKAIRPRHTPQQAGPEPPDEICVPGHAIRIGRALGFDEVRVCAHSSPPGMRGIPHRGGRLPAA
jgi:hypothetical protein